MGTMLPIEYKGEHPNPKASIDPEDACSDKAARVSLGVFHSGLEGLGFRA